MRSTPKGLNNSSNIVPLHKANVVVNKSFQAVGTHPAFTSQVKFKSVKLPWHQRLKAALRHLLGQTPPTSAQEHVNTFSKKIVLSSVRGIADRSLRLVDANHPFPGRDLVFLGLANSYSAPVIALQYKDEVRLVMEEASQLVVRGLHLDIDQAELAANVILADGNSVPIKIQVTIAV